MARQRSLLILLVGFAVSGLGLGGCQRAVCPTNTAGVGSAAIGPGKAGAKPPATPAGTYDKNGRLRKRNAFHPSHYASGTR